MLQNLKRSKTVFFFFYILCFILLAAGAGCSIAKVDEGMHDTVAAEDSLKQKVIRFHVVANSGSKTDQAVKLQVRDAVTEYLYPLLADSSKAADTALARTCLQENLSNVTEVANRILDEAGVSYGCEASLGISEFPLKIYGDIALPPGEYEALRIVLGDGQGQNWWCLMFPPLCFVDASTGIVPEEGKETLQGLLTEKEYQDVVQTEHDTWKPEFLLVKWIKKLLKFR